ncbi:MAG: hypothetical protein M1825_001480 [Sarcosagium campestre]|nr:MAG: hypothetical protein M1825_001480 [Sarcosagium campestre]
MGTKIQLPGYGLPLSWMPENPIPCALYEEVFDDLRTEALTAREIAMIRFMDSITDKAGWQEKIYDEGIRETWWQELQQVHEDRFTRKMFLWGINELMFKARLSALQNAVCVYDDGIYKSESSIPEAVKEELKVACHRLEDIPDDRRDWHPGSNDTVLDLVHPSLFPLIYGRSRIMPESVHNLEEGVTRAGQGEVVPLPDEEAKSPGQQAVTRHGLWSSHFQWLPCDVRYDNGAGKFKIQSYINNLHPLHHGDLYEVLEKIITAVVPQWNLTLTPIVCGTGLPPRIECQGFIDSTYDSDPNRPEENSDNEDEYWELKQEWELLHRHPIHPEPRSFKDYQCKLVRRLKECWGIEMEVTNDFEVQSEVAVEDEDLISVFGESEDSNPPEPKPGVNLKDDYENGLQIIVKLANIHLTPEKPVYEGGSWHVEGQLNEHICATALYYYDSENITTSHLSFRKLVEYEGFTNDGGVTYEQGDFMGPEEVYGFTNGESAIQEVAYVNTKTLQHRLGPFELEDKTRPGHRKILALFLVDPNARIISTANVACQQEEWVAEQLGVDGLLQKVPPEILQMIKDRADFPITMDEAKKYRLDLMEERKAFQSEHTKQFEDWEFSLCEH